MCMRRIITLSIALLLGALLHVCFAQELKVKSFQVSEGDLIARTSPRNDLNGKPCAVIRVGIALQNVQFAGNLMGDPIAEPGEYLIYMPQGNTELTIRHNNYLPLIVNFFDYGIGRLQSGCTYRLTILTGNNDPEPEVQGNFLILNITPKQSRISIDGGDPVSANNEGVFKTFLEPGSHTYHVASEGYEPQTERIVMRSERMMKTISLRSVKSSLTVNSSTPGASIYINEEYKGTTRWQGVLNSGTYLLEARMEGYRSAKQTVTLGKQEERNVTFPALQPIYGSLMVDYEPVDADVYVDGKLLGKSPNLFTKVFVGTHELKVVKEGFASHIEKVTISENRQASVSGKLDRQINSVSISSSSSGAQTGSTKDREEFNVKGVKFSMIRVEGGTFRMGATKEMKDPDSNETPVHEVTLSTYYLGETEVTQALWQAVMGTTVRDQRDKANTSRPLRGEGADYPMYYISWEECQQFITKLNQLTGRTFSLPTEAQWEYAARGGNKSRHTQYSGSETFDDVAWYGSNSGGNPHPVGEKLPNELGLYDMSGNVGELCSDRYGKYSSSSQTDPTGPKSGINHVCRGGSCYSSLCYCRISHRSYYSPSQRGCGVGIRLALL